MSSYGVPCKTLPSNSRGTEEAETEEYELSMSSCVPCKTWPGTSHGLDEKEEEKETEEILKQVIYK